MPPSPARPRDAAGLVLIRKGGRGPEVLLGRRHAGSAFMPGAYVTPGGRLEVSDARISGFPERLASQPAGLDAGTRRRLAALARCALRETYEETGLLLGRPAAAPSTPAGIWRVYARAGLAPAFACLRLIARAISPTDSPIRFHSRFFLAEGAGLVAHTVGDGELDDLRWVPPGEAAALPMAEVTRLVLGEALAHRAAAARGRSRPAARFVRRRGLQRRPEPA